jgi:hypothetical protein
MRLICNNKSDLIPRREKAQEKSLSGRGIHPVAAHADQPLRL